MPFASGPVLTYVGLGRYRTVGPTVYVGKRDVFTIPSDFETDLATVPRIFWALLPPHGTYEKAATWHDWAITDGIRQGLVTSRDADGIFRRIAAEGGTAWPVCWLLWWGVRLAAPFSKHRRPAQFLRDAPAVAAITAATLAVAVVAAWALDSLVHHLI